VTPGRDYWLRVLNPYSRQGYKRGLVDAGEVILVNDQTAHEVHLPRPSASGHWARADLLPALEPADHDLDSEERRGILYSMTRPGTERQELSA
jgi:hypothetical protein